MPKRVVTSRPLAAPVWQNATVTDIDGVLALEGTTVVLGSLRLCRELLARGAVDEVRLVVCPVEGGAGARLFDAAGAPKSLRMKGIKDLVRGS